MEMARFFLSTTSDLKIKGLKRELQELSTLYEISQALTSSLDLESVLKEIFGILHRHMGMERGTITLLDEKTLELSIRVAYGIPPQSRKRGRYKIGEGITGKVVEAGEPIVIPNVGSEPLFLDRTKSRGDIKKKNISFICVPIKIENKAIGALSVDRLFDETISFEEDLRLLAIISSMVAQAVRIQNMIARERESLMDENRMLREELGKKYRFENIIGDSKKMQEVYHAVSLVAPTKATVLLRGESGTGKELIAKAIHYNSPRSGKPFIKFSCGALPETLLESELFGYEKGAFTGAVQSKPGKFELADGGTLFLDEIGDISPTMQVKLLRVLQERSFERVGGVETIKVDIRLISATNKNLEQAVRDGVFREDFYYRLNVVPIFLPPLRERVEDISVLVDFFVHKFSLENGKEIKGLTKRAWEFIHQYRWPGNVRELENSIERAVIVSQSSKIDLADLPDHVRSVPPLPKAEPFSNLPEAIAATEKKLISEALEKSRGNRRKAAKALGITERILNYKLKQNPGLMP
ncbi:MAG TPA: nif-specific transcriptional activator NifA [Candidatus Omnitrophota bacterium]|nr:nif-specific transcriptional activator NifA [Candidatus Omnitrophota bacterium]